MLRAAVLLGIALVVYLKQLLGLTGTPAFLLDLLFVGGGAGLLAWVWMRSAMPLRARRSGQQR